MARQQKKNKETNKINLINPETQKGYQNKSVDGLIPIRVFPKKELPYVVLVRPDNLDRWKAKNITI